jgi:Uncharacterized protein conserved in bacteria
MGKGFEIVLHSLGVDDHSIKKIINGYYTDRSANKTINEYTPNLLSDLTEQMSRGELPIRVYFCENSNGDVFKSATMGIKGEGGKMIGMICLNFSLNIPVSEIVSSLCPPEDIVVKKIQFVSRDSDDYDDIIRQTVLDIKTDVMSNTSIPGKYKNKEIIRRLHIAGVFSVKDSVAKCAEILNTSKNTVYMHLRNIGA